MKLNQLCIIYNENDDDDEKSKYRVKMHIV